MTPAQLTAIHAKYGDECEVEFYVNYWRVYLGETLIAKAMTIEELLA